MMQVKHKKPKALVIKQSKRSYDAAHSECELNMLQ